MTSIELLKTVRVNADLLIDQNDFVDLSVYLEQPNTVLQIVKSCVSEGLLVMHVVKHVTRCSLLLLWRMLSLVSAECNLFPASEDKDEMISNGVTYM